MFGKMEIHNFGPIKDAKIDTSPLTIFVGPQATGKSLTSQLFFLFNNIYEILSKSSVQHMNLDPTRKFYETVKWLFGNNLDNLLNKNTYIKWENYDKVYEFTGDYKKGKINDQLINVINNQSQYYPDMSVFPTRFHDNIFIPAERTIFSLINPEILLGLRAEVQKWPGNLLLFYDILSESLRIINNPKEYLRDEGGWAGISFYLEELEIISNLVKNQSNILLEGELNASSPQDISLQISGKKISISYAASGQKEIWPYLVILQSNFLNLYRAHRSSNFYYEEPEAHLHPKGQLDLLKIINITLHSRENYLITTHSPYLLYFFNNSVLAGIKLAKENINIDYFDNNDYLKRNKLESFLSKDIMSAFAFNHNGVVKNIVNSSGLIDESEFDDVANQLGIEFQNLQEKIIRG